MALQFENRVWDTTETTGQGAIVMNGAPPVGYRAFSALTDGATTKITIQDTEGNYEVSEATWTAATSTLTRDRVIDSSNGGAKVDFGAGSKDVFISFTEEEAPALTRVYETGEITITPSAQTTYLHNFGMPAKLIAPFLKCKTAELGYAVDEEVLCTFGTLASGIFLGVSIASDATNITVEFAGNAQTFRLFNRSSNTYDLINNGNWCLIVRAYV